MSDQLFRKEKEDISNYNIWKSVKEFVLSGITEFFNNAYSSKGLGELLYNPKYADIVRGISKDIFVKTYSQIFESFNAPGTYNNLILILKAIFGENCLIQFENPSPGVLNINITQYAAERSKWITKPDEDFIINNESDYIVFNEFISQTYIDEVVVLFKQYLQPEGIFYNININYA